jgi:hypothetical protein
MHITQINKCNTIPEVKNTMPKLNVEMQTNLNKSAPKAPFLTGSKATI